MFSEIQDIHEDCQELFICLPEFVGQHAQSIKLAGISELRTQYKIGRVGPETHLLIFTRDGYGKLQTDLGEFVIEPQTLTVLPAGKGFTFELAGDEWQTSWFILQDCALWQTVPPMGQVVYHCREVNVVSSMLSLLHQQHELARQYDEGQVYQDKRPGLNAMEIDLMDGLVFYIKAALGASRQLSALESRVQDFMNKLPAQLHMPWSTEKIAKELHISEPHLFRIFKAVADKSPMQYLADLRIQHACELLKNTNLNIEQIALCIGYKDATSFSHRFRKSMGSSPGIWKKRF